MLVLVFDQKKCCNVGGWQKKPCCLIVLPKLSEWNKWDLGLHGEPVVTLKYQPSNAIQKLKSAFKLLDRRYTNWMQVFRIKAAVLSLGSSQVALQRLEEEGF